MAAPVRIRAGDRDRDRATTDLREHHAQGRLDVAEFVVRMERAQAATYLDELSPLFVDLPAARERRVGRPASVSRRPQRRPGVGPVLATTGVLQVVAALCLPFVAIMAVGHVFLPFGLPLLVLWLLTRRTPLWHHPSIERHGRRRRPATYSSGAPPASAASATRPR